MMLAALSVGLYTDNSILKSILVCMTDTTQKYYQNKDSFISESDW